MGTFFDKDEKKVEGINFGTYSFDKEGKYQETIKCGSWDDKSMVGTQPTFDWEISDKDNYHQKGYLNSDTYKNHLVEEQYGRLEPIQKM